VAPLALLFLVLLPLWIRRSPTRDASMSSSWYSWFAQECTEDQDEDNDTDEVPTTSGALKTASQPHHHRAFASSPPASPPSRPGLVRARSVAGGGGGVPASERDPRYRRPSADFHEERVVVRVYDLGRTFVTRLHNRLSRDYGMFHTGVEVYGREWSFGMTLDELATGITWCRPAENQDHSFRESIVMGCTSRSPRQVLDIIEQMKAEWRGSSYHVFSRNCHHFSNALCRRLGVGTMPTWVNELADAGAQTVDFLDSADSGYDGGKAIFDFFGGVRRSVYGAFAGESENEPARREPWSPPPDEYGGHPWGAKAAQRRRHQRRLSGGDDPFGVFVNNSSSMPGNRGL